MSDSCDHCEGLENFIHKVLQETFLTMHAMDREHKFWNGSNMLATFHKISGFSSLLINENINSALGANACIFSEIIYGGDHLKEKYWGILKENNCINYSWLTYTAWNHSSLWGDLNIVRLGELINKLNIQDQMEKHLSELEKKNYKIEILSEEWVPKVKSIANMA